MSPEQIREARKLSVAGLAVVALLMLLVAQLVRPSGPSGAAGTPPAPEGLWQYIVIHHSASESGSAAAFDEYHRQVRGWGELGYHFVIGNGTGSGDGQVEVGPRWTRQRRGAHCQTASGRFNEHGIGICMVGNFENTRPTAAQLAALDRLVRELMDRYRIPPQNVVSHSEALALDGEGRTTLCAGRNLDMDALRRSVGGE